MTPQTALELHFGDGEYLFDLKLPQLAELQEKCGSSIFAIYRRVMQGRYVYEGEVVAFANEGDAFDRDLFETIRLGLIGGGKGLVDGQEVRVSALTAKALVERYCYPAPLRDSWAVAAAILSARIEGYVPPKKAEPAEAPASSKRTRKSTLARSSRTAAPSASTGEP